MDTLLVMLGYIPFKNNIESFKNYAKMITKKQSVPKKKQSNGSNIKYYSMRIGRNKTGSKFCHIHICPFDLEMLQPPKLLSQL